MATLWASASLPAAAFDMTSDAPISVSADSARLDDAQGIATYTGDVVIAQGDIRLTADLVTILRNSEGVSRIEASGRPAHYRQPAGTNLAATDAQAQRITFTVDENRLTFEGAAVIEQEGNLFRGERIDYDTSARVVTAEGRRPGEAEGRVEMIIQPRSTRTEP
ncbi:MAG: lipopolysaccharide transport periplasmic protein LptA [Marinobacter sp.]|nr:lipopolysaccharide transport periplasmic protein LptA [Marinobacter sp.]